MTSTGIRRHRKATPVNNDPIANIKFNERYEGAYKEPSSITKELTERAKKSYPIFDHSPYKQLSKRLRAKRNRDEK